METSYQQSVGNFVSFRLHYRLKPKLGLYFKTEVNPKHKVTMKFSLTLTSYAKTHVNLNSSLKELSRLHHYYLYFTSF